MLLPKKLDPETSEVRICDDVLQSWLDNLPPEAQHQEITGDNSLDLSRALLHMIYYTTVSALHRPQVFQSAPPASPQSPGTAHFLEWSRLKVREAASRITSLAQAIDQAGLVKYLPTTGVTVLLPAIIIHLLDIKALDEETRRNSLRGFCQCMNVVFKLRDMYAAADYSIAFLDAAVRKAGIHVSTLAPTPERGPSSKMHPVMTVEDLLDAGRRLDMITMPPPQSISGSSSLTPPPDAASLGLMIGSGHVRNLRARNGTRGGGNHSEDDEVTRRLETFLASTPPDSEDSPGIPSLEAQADMAGSIASYDTGSMAATGTTMLDTTIAVGERKRANDMTTVGYGTTIMPELEQDDFDALLNFDEMGEKGAWSFDDGGVHGFTHDMDWLGASSSDNQGMMESGTGRSTTIL